MIEHWNSVKGFIMYGKGGKFATNRHEDQKILMLAFHLLRLCLVYINTLMMQKDLREASWQEKLQPEDLRALTPLLYGHVTPYGTFRLDMKKRLVIEQAARVCVKRHPHVCRRHHISPTYTFKYLES